MDHEYQILKNIIILNMIKHLNIYRYFPMIVLLKTYLSFDINTQL